MFLRIIIYVIFSYSDILSDEPFDEWVKKWNRIETNEKLSHMQKFFRMLLSDDINMYYYYSFCRDDIFDDNCYWHCIKGRPPPQKIDFFQKNRF
jgi:hypothetical protein